MKETNITLLVGAYGLACILAGFWAGTQNWIAFALSLSLIAFIFYKLITE